MTPPQAIMKRLKLLSAAEQEPEVTDDELEALIEPWAVNDRYGVSPEESDWIPTYDMPRAVAEVWEIKASKAANMVDFDVDGSEVSNSQIYEHCMAQAETWKRKASPRLWVK